MISIYLKIIFFDDKFFVNKKMTEGVIFNFLSKLDSGKMINGKLGGQVSQKE